MLELLLATTLIGLLMVFFVVPLLTRTRCGPANKTKCRNNLVQLGIAAIQYSDDKRFFPHVSKNTQLDGGETSNHTPKIVRALNWTGYHDNPEGWICPSSFDEAQTITDANVRERPRWWFWNQQHRSSDGKNPLTSSEADPNLEDTFELSYAWTRRGLSRNARSTIALAADRARQTEDSLRSVPKPGHVGNHKDGWNVVRVDASVEFVSKGHDANDGKSSAIEWLTSTEKTGQALAMHTQPRRAK